MGNMSVINLIKWNNLPTNKNGTMKNASIFFVIIASMFTIFAILPARAQQYSHASSMQEGFQVPQIPFAPKNYICYRTSGEIKVDGNLNEGSWNNAAWTDYFADIEGDSKPTPIYRTRVKMLWDNKYLYIAAEIQEPNLWATLRQKDTVIYYDNDFEIFIDPNGSTQPYYETEINPLGTVWDLLLTKPYRDGNRVAVNAWDIEGLKVGIALHGTLNNPSDVDTGWTVELAFPWKVLGQCASNGAPPKEGAQWRINFSRVEWQTEVEKGIYVKKTDPKTGQILPENNWVWLPQGVIDMHYPEMWGFLQFSDTVVGHGTDKFKWNSDEDAKSILRRIYYAEKNYRIIHGEFTDDISTLGVGEMKLDGYTSPKIKTTFSMFEAIIANDDTTKIIHIRDDGKTWETKYR